MKDYKQFIKQLPTSTIVCALGEFNPPTTAHELLIKTVQIVSEQKNADHAIFTSPSELISEEKKEHFLKLMFPKAKFQSLGESFFVSTVKQLTEKYRKVIIIAGADQFAEFKKLKESANVEIISIGTKDPDADNAKMKQYVTKGLYEDFKKLLPSTIRDIDGKRLMNEMRTGMQLEPIKEQLVLVKDKLREKYFKGEIFNIGDIVESNGQLYQIVKRGSNHLLLKEQSGELVSKWIHDVKQVKEAVIQPNGTDKVEPNAPESDTGAKQEMTPKGKTKGFLTFYNYKTGGTPTEGSRSGNANAVGSENIRTVREDCGCEEETEDGVNGEVQVFDPTHVGHTLVKPDSPHDIRRMKVKHHLGEQIIGTQHTGSMHHSKTPSTDRFHDKEAKAKMRASLALKHAKEKETLSHKQEKEKAAMQNEELNVKTLTADEIAAKHNVPLEDIKKQIEAGIKIEHEHATADKTAEEIARDHLAERPDYYKRLKRFVEGVPSPTGDLKNACWKGYTAVGTKKKNGKTVPNCVPVNEWVVKHDGVDANHPDETTRKLFSGKKDVINHLTKYKDSAEKRAKLLQGKGFKNVRIEETVLNPLDPHGDYKEKSKVLHQLSLDKQVDQKEVQQRKLDLDKEYSKLKESNIWKGWSKAYPETKPKDPEKEKQIRVNKDSAILDAIRAKKEKEQKAMGEEVELQEGKMGQIHADIEDHLGKHLADYKAHGGAEHFANKVLKTHDHIAKLHGLEKKHAVSLVNNYVDSRINEETNEQSADRKKQLKRFNDQAKGSMLNGGIPHPTQSLPGSERPFDPFFKEEVLDEMVNELLDEEIEELYEEDEILFVYEDTGEEVEHHPEEAKIDLMEVLSRQERLKGKIRLRKTVAKRERSTKIALKRFSNPQTVNKRARRLAIKLMKKRILRGRDPSKISVAEKERVEKMMASRKDIVNRIALKLVPRIRKVEKARMSHGKVTKGAMPSVF